MTHIVYSYILQKNHNRLLQEFLENFPSDFQEKILKYKNWEDAQLSLLGRLLLKYGLRKINKAYLDKELHYSKYNKPYLLNSEVRFNISHSGDIVVCAITDSNDIGIDIEKIYEINVNDFKSQLTAAEWKQLKSSDNTKNTFFKYWTKKEAVIKANGMGLSLPLNSFDIVNNHTSLNEENFFIKEIELDLDYKCHLAFKNKFDPIISVPSKIDF